MFGFHKKYKYTAYKDKNKDHNYTLNDDEDEESESFLVDEFEDMPSDNNNDYNNDDNTVQANYNWPKNLERPQNGSDSTTPSISMEHDDKDRENKKDNASINYPDPEIDERIEPIKKNEKKKKKISLFKRKDNTKHQHDSSPNDKQDKDKNKNKNKKKEGNFMSKMISAIKNKVSKKKPGYDKGTLGEKSLTPFTASDDDSDYNE